MRAILRRLSLDETSRIHSSIKAILPKNRPVDVH